MSAKQIKKVRKFYKQGLQQMGINDFTEYSQIVNKKIAIYKLTLIFFILSSIIEFVMLILK